MCQYAYVYVHLNLPRMSIQKPTKWNVQLDPRHMAQAISHHHHPFSPQVRNGEPVRPPRSNAPGFSSPTQLLDPVQDTVLPVGKLTHTPPPPSTYTVVLSRRAL
ncbi:hypothetical protein LZ31DRAFT_325996 [Colletotrichum somersetense]|nr:hypothetical protein LZ31DRAFT_325996 [Colletotrichum somersetense]